jgi:hypothetical protein
MTRTIMLAAVVSLIAPCIGVGAFLLYSMY